MAALIEGALARVLEKHRESLNARFAAATTRRSIDRHSFSSHVREVIAPIVESVEGVDDAAPERVTLALYDLSLQLFASDLLGSTARTGAVAYAWRRLLPLLPHLIRIDARRVVGVVTNAVVNVGAHIDPTLWTDDMIRVSDASLDFEGLLDTGRIAAWRRGVTHYRSAALEALGRLPETLSAQLLAIPVAAVPSAIVQLRANRWVDPALAMNAEPTLRLLGSYGSFRGFGGGFVKRPHVFEWENRLIVTSGDRQWELHADRFGATLLPLRSRHERSPSLSGLVHRNGVVELNGKEASMPALHQPTSAAQADGVLAVTLKHSFGVYIVGVF